MFKKYGLSVLIDSATLFILFYWHNVYAENVMLFFWYVYTIIGISTFILLMTVISTGEYKDSLKNLAYKTSNSLKIKYSQVMYIFIAFSFVAYGYIFLPILILIFVTVYTMLVNALKELKRR